MGYYIANDGVQQGPFELIDLPSRGLRPDSLVWTEGMADWLRADGVPPVANLLQAQRAAAAPAAAVAPQNFAPVSPQAPYPIAYHQPVASQGNGMAVASMVMGIVAFPISCFYLAGIVCAVLAIIFGYVARGKIARGETADGAGMATAGIVLGFIYVSLIALVIIVAVLFGVGAAITGMHRGF